MANPTNVSPIIETPADPRFQGGGSFQVGTQSAFFFFFNDINGTMYDPSDINISIFDPDGTLANSGTELDKLGVGVFGYAWTIPVSTGGVATPTGTYSLTLTYVVETIDGPDTNTSTEDFVVLESGGSGSFTIRQISGRAYLETLLQETQRIPVYNEILRFNKAKTVGEVTFGRWNQPAGARVYLNGQIKESGFDVDWWKGRITFPASLSQRDEVTVDYNFRWFSNEQMDAFLQQGVNVVNIWPPQSVYNIETIPDRWIIAAEYAAAIDAIRSLMFSTQYQSPAKIYGTQRINDVFNHFDTLKKNFESQLDKMLEQKKYGSYLGLTKTVTVPEFTLPGGRCLAHDSLITYMVDSKEVISTINELHELSQSQSVSVLSDKNGELIFTNATRIWESGTKLLLEIKDDLGNKVEVSEDHIMFIDDKEVPASKVSIGDILTVIADGEIRHSTVKSVEVSRETLTFDIEVPSTENLFVNNIKCHNSRWFRYLFKGG